MFNINRKDYSKDINKWIALCKLSQAERMDKQPRWDDIDDYLRGIQWQSWMKDGVDIITVNLVYSHVKVVVPSTYARYPKIYFEPQNPAAVDGARLLEVVLNADMRKMKLKDVNKRIVQDVVLYGTGFSKTTFEVEGDEVPEEDLNTAEELQNKFQDMKPPSIVGGSLSLPVANPHLARISPRNIGFSVGITDLGDPGFIAHWERKRLASVKNNPFYKNTKNLQPTERIRTDLKTSLGSYGGFGAEEYLDYVMVYEIWDVDKQKWFTIVEDYGQYISEPEDNPYPVDHPFDMVKFTPIEGELWGMSTVEPWLPQQDELNKLRTQGFAHTRRYNRKYLAREGAFASDEDKVKLVNGEDGVVVDVRALPGQPLSETITPLSDAPMPQDNYRQAVMAEDDIVKIGGVPPYRRAGTVGANTATEANLAESGAEIGDSDRVDAFSEFTLSQLEKVRKMRAKLTIGRHMVDFTGNPMDEARWQYWTRDDIDIETQMCIEIGSTRPVSDESRKQDAMVLYQNALANPTVNPQSAFIKLLDAYGERNVSSWFLPSELIQLQMMLKVLGAQREQKGISPMANVPGAEPGPNQPTETPAEVSGRGAPSSQAVA